MNLGVVFSYPLNPSKIKPSEGTIPEVTFLRRDKAGTPPVL